MSDLKAVTYETAYAATLSDSAADPSGPFAALQATTGAGLAKVTTVSGQAVTIYLGLGQVVNLAVTRVWSSTTTATGIIGMRARPYQGSTGT